MDFEDDYTQHGLHKSTECETLFLILDIPPSSFRIEHIKRYQDSSIPLHQLNTHFCLNVDADEVATTNDSNPINNHIKKKVSYIREQ